MDSFYNFNNLSQSICVYGGSSCKKYAFSINGNEYFLKFPSNLNKAKDLESELGPFAEYIGSHIYNILGLSAHSTYLGEYDNQVVVACKNFLNKAKGERLLEASLILKNVNTSPDNYDGKKNYKAINIKECEKMIALHPLFNNIKEEALEHFWDMLVIDTYIGNAERSNEDWGVIIDMDDNVRLAPIYDNDRSFNEKAILQEELLLEEEFKKAILRNVPKIQKAENKIYEMIDNTPKLSTLQKNFYKDFLHERLDNLLEIK